MELFNYIQELKALKIQYEKDYKKRLIKLSDINKLETQINELELQENKIFIYEKIKKDKNFKIETIDIYSKYNIGRLS